MKAKVKATGEIVEIVARDTKKGFSYTKDNTFFYDDDLDFDISLPTEQDTAPCDPWEERRAKIAAILMQSTSWKGYNFHVGHGFEGDSYNRVFREPRQAAEIAVSYADALINELKKQKNDKR